MIDDGIEEVDWRSYVEIIEKIINGEYDYDLLKGENGYCVYPAAFVYQFYLIYYLTLKGSPLLSLFLFMFLYFIMIYIIFKVYDSVIPKEYQWIKIFVIISTPMQKAMINHRFNDGLAMIQLYLCLYFLINNQKKGLYYATFFYAFALNTKTNILLFLPGLLYTFTKIRGPLFCVIQLIIIILCHLIIGYPFISVNAASYFGKTFDFSREFLYFETLNWQFLPEEIFHSKTFYKILMIAHLSLLLIFLLFKWEKISINIFKDLRLNDWSSDMKVVSMNKIFIVRVMFICNLIGVLCFRSLHYQFIIWFFASLPFLTWQTRLNDFVKVISLLCYQYVWTYRRCAIKSLFLLMIHLSILVCLFCYDIPCNKKPSEIQITNNDNKNKNKNENNNHKENVQCDFN